MDRAALRPVLLRATGLLAVSLLVLLLVLRKAGAAEVVVRLSAADPVLVASAILLFGLEIMTRMARSVLLVRDLPAHRTVAAWAVGSGVNEVAPPGASEAARAWVASRWYGASAARVFAPAILERIFDVFVLGALGLTAVAIFADVPTAVAAGVGLAGAIIALALAVTTWNAVERLAGRSGVRGRVGGFAVRVHEAFRATAKRPAALAGAMALTLVVWVLAVSEQVLVLQSVGLTLDFALMAGVTGASVLVGIASFLPGGLGAREGAYAALLTSAHHSYAAVASGVIAFRVLQASVMLTLATAAAAFVIRGSRGTDDAAPGRNPQQTSRVQDRP